MGRSAPNDGELGAPESPPATQPPWRRAIVGLANALLNVSLQLGPRSRGLLDRVDKVALTILAALLTLPLVAPSAELSLLDFTHAKEFSIAVAGLIGTVVVLAFTLSIIPVQRAAEAMPVSVVRLFARDPVNRVLFVALALLCLLSFSLAVYPRVFLTQKVLLPLQLLLLGVAFDLVRWHHRHTLLLLEPVYAIAVLRRHALRSIIAIDRRVRLAAGFQWLLIGSTARRQTPRDRVVALIYRSLPDAALSVSQWARELEEASLRSVEQGEIRIASAAVDALTEIACTYLIRRRHTQTPILANLLGVYESDLREVLTPLYEGLNRIELRAIAAKNAPVGIRVIQGFGQIALTCATLKSNAFPEQRAPLTGLPIAYLDRCAQAAASEGLHDVGLNGSMAVVSASLGAPKNVDLNDVHIPVADAILHILSLLYS